MKKIQELHLKIDGKRKVVKFGIPNTDFELKKMYALRYQVYSTRGYINPLAFPDKLDIDQYDKDKKCIYFVAQIDGQIIGSVRIIKDKYLPIETECYEFDEPEAINKIPRKRRAEIGRLVVRPYSNTEYLPRNLIMLLLIDSLVKYGTRHNIPAVYAFLKTKLLGKLEKLKVPIHLIKPYKQVYPKDGVLSGYFYKKEDKAVPAYFLTSEVKEVLDQMFSNENIFEKGGRQKLTLKENFYNKFLKVLKVI